MNQPPQLRLVPSQAKNSALDPAGYPHRVAILALPNSDLFDIAGPFEAFVRAGQIVQQQRTLAAPFYTVDLLTVRGRTIPTWLGPAFDERQAVPVVQAFSRYVDCYG
jgi:hypothetical protein